MIKALAMTVLVLALAGAAYAAEKFEDKTLGISVDSPEGFTKAPEAGAKDEFIGEPKAIYASPDVAESGAILLIHHMDIPAGTDFATLKTALPDLLKTAFGDTFKLVKQEDLKVDKLTGFVMDFECPGDGQKPAPGGSIPHHVRWLMIKSGDSKIVGLIYTAKESAWKAVDPKFAASAKTLKSTS